MLQHLSYPDLINFQYSKPKIEKHDWEAHEMQLLGKGLVSYLKLMYCFNNTGEECQIWELLSESNGKNVIRIDKEMFQEWLFNCVCSFHPQGQGQEVWRDNGIILAVSSQPRYFTYCGTSWLLYSQFAHQYYFLLMIPCCYQDPRRVASLASHALTAVTIHFTNCRPSQVILQVLKWIANSYRHEKNPGSIWMVI